jgi:hypothetical protein
MEHLMAIPINDLGSGKYKGFPGYLYDGSNERPVTYQAPTISPVNGVIGFASLGISNSRDEFNMFRSLYENDSQVNSEVKMATGSFSGQMANQYADPNDDAWDYFENGLTDAGLLPEQLKVVWSKNSPHPNQTPGSFPVSAEIVQDWMRDTLINLKDKYPSVEIVYHSSRIYGGYGTPHSHEPIAYEHGLATKWLIDEYVEGNGVPGLWLAWGPYLWANGSTPRNDGLVWNNATGKGKKKKGGDFVSDGIHPNASGQTKVANMLWDFLSVDDSADWFWQ